MPTTKFSSKRLRALRVRAGLSRTALGFKVDRSADAVGFWERGDSQPRPEFVPRIAEALGCAVEDLFEPNNDDDPAGRPGRRGTASGRTHVAA